VKREGGAVHLFTCCGYDWAERYPAIASAAAAGTGWAFVRYPFHDPVLNRGSIDGFSEAPILDRLGTQSRP
jgi:hypothetical protein